MVTFKKIKEHAGEVWHSNVIESGAHDNFYIVRMDKNKRKRGGTRILTP